MAPTREALCRLLPSYVESVLDVAALDGGESRGVAFYDGSDGRAPAKLDATIISALGLEADSLRAAIRPVRLRVRSDGALYCLDDCVALSFGAHLEILDSLGLRFYQGWCLDATGSPKKLDHVPESGQGPYLFRYQRASYDPVAHARGFLRNLDFVHALEILQAVPDHWFEDDIARGEHALEMMVALLAQDRSSRGEYGLDHLKAGLHQYNRACTWIPENHGVYLCMAAFWRGIGRPDLGRRLLETVQTIAPSARVEQDLGAFDTPAPQLDTPRTETYVPNRPLRVLILCHPESDFGSDVLHDGLRRVLGPGNVVGFPWKPVLHGQDEDAATGYPCTFNWPDPPVPVEDIVARARQGGFDAILYSDTLGTLPRAETRAILDASGDTPLFIVDMWDECGDSVAFIRERDGLEKVAGYFKREMLAGMAYGAHTWPLPFAYPEDRIPPSLSWETRAGVFWAGKLMGGARRLQMSWLEREVPLNAEYGTPFTPDAYAARLQAHLMGISLPGNGFDTVRYWELPAHGTLLLSERLPIAIPNDFEDGKHAVFFDTVAELKEKVLYYLAHRDEAESIARAGHEHLKAYHTGSARARQCLGHIQAYLEARDSDRPVA